MDAKNASQALPPSFSVAELQRDLEALKARIGQMEGVAGETAVTEKEESK